jgi:hypothetical protein
MIVPGYAFIGGCKYKIADLGRKAWYKITYYGGNK